MRIALGGIFLSCPCFCIYIHGCRRLLHNKCGNALQCVFQILDFIFHLSIHLESVAHFSEQGNCWTGCYNAEVYGNLLGISLTAAPWRQGLEPQDLCLFFENSALECSLHVHINNDSDKRQLQRR